MQMENAASRFTGKSQAYASARPGYPPELAEKLRERGAAGAEAADIGAGTGLFTRLLLGLGCTVCAVEPNDEMRAQAQRKLGAIPGFSCRKGTAEDTGLPDGSVSLVTAAQSFHWFSAAAFRRECLRILRPGGAALLVWNARVEEAPVMRSLSSVFRRFCPQFAGFMGGDFTRTEADIRLFFGGEPERWVFPHPLHYTEDAFLRRCYSSSYSLREGEEGFDRYTDSLRAVFAAHAKDGVLLLPNETTAYWGRPGEASQ